MPNSGTLKRARCESCGAPLGAHQPRGRVICQYCGAEYYFDGQTGYIAEEIQGMEEKPSVDDTTAVDYTMPPVQRIAEQKRRPRVGWVIAGVILIGLMFVCILSGVISRMTGRSSGLVSQISKPVMLTTLPDAERAGTSVAFKDWQITVSPEIETNSGQIYLSLSIKNWSDKAQSLSYIPNNFVVYDDLGNTYPLTMGYCDVDLPYLERQVTFEPYEQGEFSSDDSWCNRPEELPAFSGVIPVDAAHLYFYFKDFGVFKNIIFVYDM